MADIFDLFRKISEEKPVSGPPTHIIAGLGNPGDAYINTRHNVGFMALDVICSDIGLSCTRSKFSSLCALGKLGDFRVLLMKPQTFMNNSGEALRQAAEYYGIPPENIIVIVDDINLAPGRMRIRRGGTDGGHNGLKSIIYQLEADTFPRIRIGVGQKPQGWDLADWVLGNFSRQDAELLKPCLGICREAALLIMIGKIDEAMGKCNGMKPEAQD